MMFLYDIANLVPDALRLLGALVCNLIYLLIANLFETFFALAELNLLNNVSIQPIYQRVTMILTIVMVFYITFEFVKYIVQPDNISDKQKGAGNLAVRLVLVIVLIAFVPKIFTIAYDLQGRIIKQDIFSKIILGTEQKGSKKKGYSFSADMLELFYEIDDDACDDAGSACDDVEDTVDDELRKLRTKGTVNLMNDITERDSDGDAIIKFDGLLAIIVGVLILYVVAMYCIDISIRVFQMMYLQIIAPIAIIGYLSPKKDGMFQKWLKQCITTYIDIFIRLAIISFVLLVIDILSENFSAGKLFPSSLGGFSELLCYVALVLGLLLFAQKAPKLLQELFPNSGAASIGFGVGAKSAKERLEPLKRTIGGAAGVGYGLGNSISETIARKKDGKKGIGFWGTNKAMIKGLKAGASKDGGFRKGRDAAFNSLQDSISTIDAGGTQFKKDILGQHYLVKLKREKREVESYTEVSKKKSEVTKTLKETKVQKTIDEIASSDRVTADGEFAREFGAKKDVVKKAAQAYAAAVESGSDAEKAHALEGLQSAMKNALLGTGKLLDSHEKAIQIEQAYNLREQMRTGGLSAEQIAQLKVNGSISAEMSELLTIPIDKRTTEQKQRIESFIADTAVAYTGVVNNGTLEAANNYVSSKYIDAKDTYWGTAGIQIAEMRRITEDAFKGLSPTEYPDELKAALGGKTIEQLTAEEFGKLLGKFESAADNRISSINTSQKHRENEANASSSGSGTGKK